MSWNWTRGRLSPPKDLWLAFENFFVCIQCDFLWLAGQEDIDVAGGVSGDADLAESNHATAEVSENRDGHGKVLVNVALGNDHVQLSFPAFRRGELIVKVVSRHLSAIDPLVENPVEAAVSLNIHSLIHVLFRDGLEGFGARGPVTVGLDKVVHHGNERLVLILKVVHH